MRKKNPCPSCCRNLKYFQDKTKALEARALQAESSRDNFQLENGRLFEKVQYQFEKIEELTTEVKELRYSPARLEAAISKIYIPEPK